MTFNVQHETLIERRKIFLSDTDRNDFIGRLAAQDQDGAIEIYAWVLMPNL